MKIAILEDYQDAVRHLPCFSLLRGHEVDVFTKPMTSEEMVRMLFAYEAFVLIRERTRIDEVLLSQLPQLRVISQTGKLSGNVDVSAAQRRGVALLEGVGDPTAPAELSWALLMSAYRRIPQYVSNLKENRWQCTALESAHNTIGRALKGDVLGVWGYGKIGQRVACYARTFGMDVIVWGSEESRLRALSDGYQAAQSKDAFFSGADVVTLHLRLTESTRGLVQASDLASMKPTALLLNTSRAELIASGALLEALRKGRPGFAALDVFEKEPLGANDPLLRMPNVVATPHLGYVEQKSYEYYFAAAFRNLVEFANGARSNTAH
ncbi:MAG: D-2-hydroxyacid dehydrogenase family protein [Burkholderiales bacterium]|jgi:D-3-phosphoglycerate dehydrogenase